MFVSTFMKNLFAGAVRHCATFGGGWLVAHGVLQSNQLSSWVGSICFLGGVGWSAWDKYQRAGRI